VLDVRVARREVRRMRVRVATLAATLSLGTIFAVYVAWRCGNWALDHFVYDNKAFAIEQIDISTDCVIALEQLRSWSGVRNGANLFALDLARVKRDLELVPAIQFAYVERILPHTLRIRVVEREPIAQIQGYLVDANGYAMVPLTSQQRAAPAEAGERYPIITGISAAEVRAGRQVESPRARAALRFINAFDRSAMGTVVDIARIDVSHPEVLQVSTSQQNEITFLAGDFDRQLNRWWLVYENGLRSARQISSLDLSVADNIPLRWLDTAAVPPSPAKARKNSPYKKKHV